MTSHSTRLWFDRIGINEVSTIELAERHVENGLRYETMLVTGLAGDVDIRRYKTLEEAQVGHAAAVARLRAGILR